MRPKILITLDTGSALRRGVAFPNFNLKAAYVHAVEAAGGLPILVAPTSETEVVDQLVNLMDGLVITGGDFDIDPAHYGKRISARLDTPKPLRTTFEWKLCSAAIAQNKPVLGICGGMQLLAVVLGGTLLQDIGAEVPGALPHEQPHSPAEPAHPVHLSPGFFTALLGPGPLAVNTTHHQAVAELPASLHVFGRSPDGIIEAIAMADRPEVVGVQWHPELLDDSASRALYGHLVASARRAARGISAT